LGDSPPFWWEWDAIFRLGGALDEAAEASKAQSPFLQASRARDVMEAHYLAFDLNAVPVHEVTAAPGDQYLTVLEGDVRTLSDRVRKNFV
jgi:hypothetical protein